MTLINNEIKNKKAGKPALHQDKDQSHHRPDYGKKLYEASEAGVDIDLVVRGNCSLITNVPDVSTTHPDSWHHRPLSGTFTHFHLANGGEEKIYLVLPTGCLATWITASKWLPGLRSAIKGEMKRIVEYGLKDTPQGRIVDGAGDNLFWSEETEEALPLAGSAPHNYYLAEMNNNLNVILWTIC